MTANNNVYKTIWKNKNKEYNEKYIRCFFTISNLNSAITYKRGWIVLSLHQFIFPWVNSYCYFLIFFGHNQKQFFVIYLFIYLFIQLFENGHID